MSDDLVQLSAWVGRRTTDRDLVTPGPVAGLAATLDRGDPEPKEGDPLPPGWHWLYFLGATPASELGEDGHAARGGFLPPVALPRRMWAGAELAFHRPLRVGETVVRESEVVAVEPKRGRRGRLLFVAVRHTIAGGQGLAVEDEQRLVYREAPRPGEEAPEGRPPPAKSVWRRVIRPDPVLLFRFSALTFNGHRIHYDHAYATEVEGYPGLVVHGALTAILLLDLVRRHVPERALRRFACRAVRPLFAPAPFTVAGAPGQEDGAYVLWAEDAGGALAMEATASFA